MKKIILTAAMLLCLSGVSMAQSGGGYASPFTLGTGARDLALSGANLAHSSFATAAYWNASRLARAQRYSVTTFHSRLYDSDVAYQYFGASVPTLDLGTFGLGVMRLGVGGIDARDASNVALEGISDNRIRVYLAYGRQLSGFDVGAAASIENHSIGQYKGTSSPGLDLSVSRHFVPSASLINQISLAANGRHLLQPSMKLIDVSVSQPRQLDLGISAELQPKAAAPYAVALAASVSKVESVDPIVAAGIEFDIQKTLRIRGGVRDGKASAGAGISVRALSFDYALVDRDLGSLHMFNLTTTFGKSVDDRRLDRDQKRESEFNSLMQDQLTRRNQDMIMEQVMRGDELLTAGDLSEALSRFERAIFLARNTGSDTSQIAERAAEARSHLRSQRRSEALVMNVDSAQSRLEASDYVGAHYFASAALAIDSSSVHASTLLYAANTALEESAAHDRAIISGLLIVDSLLSYGRTEAAWERVLALEQIAPDHANVRAARIRVRFEWWRTRATEASADGDNAGTLQALDSALQLYAGHQWCLDLRAQTKADMARRTQKTAAATVRTQKLSADIEARARALYAEAMQAFERGQLNEAIQSWEEVDRMAPGYSSVRSYLVRAYKFVGVELYGHDKLDEALDVWSKAANLQPNNEEIAGYMRRAQNELRKLRELSYDPE